MDFTREWTAFALEDECDAFGFTRIADAHNHQVEALNHALDLVAAERDQHKADLTAERAAREQAEARAEQFRAALMFYARHEHWMALTEAPDAVRSDLIAHGQNMHDWHGWEEAERALAAEGPATGQDTE
jgi:hypothetical protein